MNRFGIALYNERQRLRREKLIRQVKTVGFVIAILIGLMLAAGVGHFREMRW